MKKNLEIIECEHKITKAGKPFMRFQTNEGWISCFDVKEIEKLKKFKGQVASVEIIESGEFSNIKKCYGEEQDEDKPEVVKMSKSKGFEVFGKEKVHNGAAMYTSYAKDIFCALITTQKIDSIEGCRQMSIELVQSFKEAFE